METRRRICVVTGSRAEYGLLYWIIHDLARCAEVELQLLVTGMHLAHEFGHTVREIEADGLPIAHRVEMLVSGNTAAATAKSIALGVIGFSDAFERLRPDIVLVLGDRFEVFAAAQASLVHNLVLAHVCGGDTTEGAIDEAMRHGITKMAHLHFVTNELSARRVRQLGEDPAAVHMVGNPGLDHLRRRPLLQRADLERSLGAPLGRRNALVTFHPVTLEPGHGLDQLTEMLAALEQLPEDIVLWCTRANADAGGREINALLERWVEGRTGAHLYDSLGTLRYLSLLAAVDMVVGNSSSGLYEAPSFRVPAVDIGSRQGGRLSASSVLHAAPARASIREAMQTALAMDCSDTVNPYGDGHAAERIVAQLLQLPLGPAVRRKRFHMTDEAGPC
ncbi:MAG: UDP-N-acetylglucosamine 2-epimerase (hydrolyzing) [Rubrivivax sp.]|nr:UDP-N-acetylglucosamine 2-epimerase (hydrolyzing) [Rubrivivax sp.]